MQGFQKKTSRELLLRVTVYEAPFECFVTNHEYRVPFDVKFVNSDASKIELRSEMAHDGAVALTKIERRRTHLSSPIFLKRFFSKSL